MKKLFIFIAIIFAFIPHTKAGFDYEKSYKGDFYRDVHYCISPPGHGYKGYKTNYTNLCLKKAIMDAKEHSTSSDEFSSEKKIHLMKKVLEDINNVYNSLNRQIQN